MNTKHYILNIFNGDCACDAWKKIHDDTDFLVWRESYLEGTLPPPETPLAEFEAVRADELFKAMPELDYGKLLAYLRKMNQTVLNLPDTAEVRLWFDACMYDQIMLARIIFLLQNTRSKLFLFCENVALGDSPELFLRNKDRLPRLSHEIVRLYAGAWTAAISGKNALMLFLENNDFSKTPFLLKALRRYLEDFPDADGLSRTERQLLEIIRKPNQDRTAAGIFKAVFAYEEYPFLGDTMCYRRLDLLADKGFIRLENSSDGKIYLPN